MRYILILVLLLSFSAVAFAEGWQQKCGYFSCYLESPKGKFRIFLNHDPDYPPYTMYDPDGRMERCETLDFCKMRAEDKERERAEFE